MNKFNFPRAQRNAQTLSEFVEQRLAALENEGSGIKPYADAISVMDNVEALTLLWLVATNQVTISSLPPLE